MDVEYYSHELKYENKINRNNLLF